MAVVGVPTETKAGREQGLSAGHLADLGIPALLIGILVELDIVGGTSVHEREVNAQTIGELQVAVHFKLVLQVQTQLTGLDDGSPAQVAISDGGVGALEHKLVGGVVHEVVQRVVNPLTGDRLDEQVAHLEELVVGSQGDGVTTLVPRQVVFQQIHVLIQEVGTRAILSTDVDGDIAASVVLVGHVLDPEQRTLIRHVAAVADAVVASAEFVVNARADVAVQLSHKRVGDVVEAIARVVEVVAGGTGAPLVVVGVAVLVAQSQLVVVVDVPVDAGQQVEGIALHVAAAIALLDARKLVVLVGNLLDSGFAQVVARHAGIEAGGIALVVVFQVEEEEELVLGNGTTDVTTDGGSVLLCELILDVTTSGIVAAVEVLVVVISVESGVEVVGTLLGDSVDTTAGETTLAHVEGSDHHLNLLDSVHRDGVGASLSAIGARSSQTEHVVTHSTINLETVVAVVAAGKRDTAHLRGAGHGHVLDHVVDIAVHRRGIFDICHREVVACAGFLTVCIACDDHFAELVGC